MCLVYMHAQRKLSFIPNWGFLEAHHSGVFTRDPSVEPLTAHVCMLLHPSVDTLRSNTVPKDEGDLFAFALLLFPTLLVS